MMFTKKEYYYMKESNQLALQWIAIGDEDLDAARILIENKGSFRTIGFHCQQSVEKYLKAFLVYSEIKFPRIHDLTELYKLCANVDSSIQLDLDYLINLTEFAVEMRYSVNPNIDEESLYSGYNYVQTIRTMVFSKIVED
jgi:HEPN domain-containing protein